MNILTRVVWGQKWPVVLTWRWRPRVNIMRGGGAGERGWSREQAYIICSVAVDLRISNVVDVPNYVVSALLPEDIFHGA
jgi:Acetamidase/Formamidase family